MDITTTPTFSGGAARVVLEGRYRDSVNGNTPYGVAADGLRFLRVSRCSPTAVHDPALVGVGENHPGFQLLVERFDQR